MIRIEKATVNDSALLHRIGIPSFLEAHKTSASKKDIDAFIAQNYSQKAFETELKQPNYIYSLIYLNDQIAGFSKIEFNNQNSNISAENVTILDRIYLLKAFYGKGLGVALLNFNIELSKQNKQTGMWLATWVNNKRAINFYKKLGFQIVGRYDFIISETHSNPNHIMYLRY